MTASSPARSLASLAVVGPALLPVLLVAALAFAGPAAAQTAEPVAPAPVPGVASAPEADVARSAPALDAGAAMLVEPVTGDVVYSRRAHQRRPIASTTKLMTALLVLEREPLGRVFASPGYRPVFPDESLVNLRRGERMTVADLLRGLLLGSGNDAAVDLAANSGGSVAAFVAQMNRRARELALADTHYANPIGLDAPDNYSSASDLVALAIRLRQRRWFAHTVDRGSARLRGSAGAHTVVNRNDLVRRVGFVNGVKTGHTPAAGYVLVGSGTRNGVTMVSAVLGDPGVLSRNADTLALLRYGFSRYRTATVFGSAAVLARARVRHREHDTVRLLPARAFSTVVRRGDRPPTIAVHAPDTLTGPIPRGRRAGRVDVRYRGRVIARVPLVTGEPVPEVTVAERIVTFVLRPGTLAVLLAVAIGIVLALGLRRRGGGQAAGGRAGGARDHHRHTQRRDRQDAGGPELPARPPPP
jgi:D-alanyl-D-alanine carboxypeptidase (penicillin-binding protein 5/6)